MKSYSLLMLLMLFSISFSSLLWQIHIYDEPTTQPLQLQEKFIIGSKDGNVYALDVMNGKYVWKTQVGRTVDIIEYGGKIVTLTRDGVVSALDGSGKIVWSIDLKKINETINAISFYGFEKNSKNIFATSNKAVYKIGENNAVLFYEADEIYGRPGVDENYILITAENSIIKIDMNGKTIWNKKINTKRWNADLKIVKNVFYFGGLDNNFYQISAFDGSKIWFYPTGGWIRSTPLVREGYIYFGSNDGYFHKLKENGEAEWRANIGAAVTTLPALGLVGEKQVIFASGSNGKLYALNAETGETVWASALSGGILTRPLFYKDRVAVASIDHFVYVYSMKRGCSIQSPIEGEKVGYKEIVVRGKSFSTTGQQKVFVKINEQDWIEAQIQENGDWTYYLNPQTDLQEGINIMNCKVEDVVGAEEGTYTTIAFIRDSSIPFDNFIVSIPNQPIENEPFQLYVNSKSDGAPVERFTIIINGQNYTGNKNITLILPGGNYEAVIKKMGYNDKVVTINVQSKGINPLYMGIGMLIFLAVIWVVYSKVLKK